MSNQPPHDATPWAEGPQYHEGLQDLPPEVAKALMGVGTKRIWRKGDLVQRQGHKQGHVVVCLKGRFAVMVAGPSGSDTLLRFAIEGEIVGMPTVLAGMPAPTSIVASGAGETLHIARSDFVSVLTRYPEGAIGVAILLSHKLAELFRFVEMTSHRTLHERVIYALRRLARRNGEPGKAGTTKLKVTQGELATAAGASRQRVHLELKRLQSMGLIDLGYGSVTIKTDKL
jgi:CRP/FNR family cyclic AMP-dependent transcriptional regulator